MNPIDVFTRIIAERAHQAGYEACQAGAERHAPAKFGEYSGAWVEGWNAAALEALNLPGNALAA